jgi:hypothetical protein
VRVRVRVGWLEQRRIRASARNAALRGEPALDYLLGDTVTLRERDAFFSARDLAISKLRRRAISRIATATSELQQSSKLTVQLLADVAAAEAAVEDLRRRKPTAATAVRNANESQTPDSIVLVRRQREHSREVASLAARHQEVRAALDHAIQDEQRLRSRISEVRLRYAADVACAHHLAVRKRDIFDLGLVRHHQVRGLLEQRLDKNVPDVPDVLKTLGPEEPEVPAGGVP